MTAADAVAGLVLAALVLVLVLAWATRHSDHEREDRS